MKRILSFMLIGILLLSGCDGAASSIAGLDQAKVAAMLGTAQVEANGAGTELLKGSTQTMTPFIPVVGMDYQTPTPESTALSGEYITITHIDANAAGKAILYWEAGGDFPSGFKVVWAKGNDAPVFPDDIWDYVDDGTARSAEVFGTAGESYYFRVCKYWGGACAFYSPVVSYTFAQMEATEATAQKTATVESGLAITITSIQSGGDGKANIYWNATGSFPKGFKVVWSESTSEPVYPGNEYQYLSSSSARSATVSGTPGKKTYFRVCRYDGSKCDFYSNSYAFTFTGTTAATATSASKSITITDISNVSTGKAKVTWSANGSFPKGFKVVWSDSTSTPVYPGNDYVYVSENSARTAYTTGTAGKKYTFRVCEYTGSGCGVYSNAYSFTYSGSAVTSTPDGSSISITSVTAPEPGKAVVTWSASGSFPSGFKVVWSDSTTTPVYPGNEYVYMSDSSARSATITGTPGKTIYIRVGKYTGSSCSVYSNTYTFTFTSAEPVPTATTVETEVTPEVTEVTPEATEVTPEVTEETPEVTEETPVNTEETPETGE